MTAFMVVAMDIVDAAWTADYFAQVPPILASHGGSLMAESRAVRSVEGDLPAPERMAVLTFPSGAAIDAFLADPRYQPFKDARQRGATSDIFVFESKVGTRR